MAPNRKTHVSEHDDEHTKELQRKRARDRKSQQAMRDRTRWTIAELSSQVATLSQTLDAQTNKLCVADCRIRQLEAENTNLRTLNAALQLSLLSGSESQEQQLLPESPLSQAPQPELWERVPLNIPPDCILDKLVLGVVFAGRHKESDAAATSAPRWTAPKVRAMLCKDARTECEISNMVGDVVRSCLEIDTLPRQVAIFYIVVLWLKWLMCPRPESWEALPEWLRPLPCQLANPHPGWMDRVPWPEAREYLIARPGIPLDEFVASYSVGFYIDWPYEPAHIVISSGPGGTAPEGSGVDPEVYINPVFEEHIRQLRNWRLQDSFRRRWPDMCSLIDNRTATPAEVTDVQVEPLLNHHGI